MLIPGLEWVAGMDESFSSSKAGDGYWEEFGWLWRWGGWAAAAAAAAAVVVVVVTCCSCGAGGGVCFFLF